MYIYIYTQIHACVYVYVYIYIYCMGWDGTIWYVWLWLYKNITPYPFYNEWKAWLSSQLIGFPVILLTIVILTDLTSLAPTTKRLQKKEVFHLQFSPGPSCGYLTEDDVKLSHGIVYQGSKFWDNPMSKGEKRHHVCIFPCGKIEFNPGCCSCFPLCCDTSSPHSHDSSFSHFALPSILQSGHPQFQTKPSHT